jgi:hypothetical protein
MITPSYVELQLARLTTRPKTLAISSVVNAGDYLPMLHKRTDDVSRQLSDH